MSSAFGGDSGDSEPPRGETPLVLIDGAQTECPVYARERLHPGDRLAGPALAVSVDSTCLLLGGQVAEVDELGNLLIREGPTA
jgi:N-methylhydantoinase A